MSDFDVMEFGDVQPSAELILPELQISAMDELAGHFSPAVQVSLLYPTIVSRVEREAIHWLILMENTDAVEMHWNAFQAWLEQQPEHKETYLRIERNWHQASVCITRNICLEKELLRSDTDCSGADFAVARPMAAKLAILLAVLIPAVYILYKLVVPPIGETEVETEFGKRQTVVLADHSVVTLNTDSRLHARFTWNTREVELERGEGLFHVHKERTRPFWVQTKGTVVRATGTEFSVRVNRESDVVSVSDGKVEIRPKASSAAVAAEKEIKPVTAEAGEVAVVDPRGDIHVERRGVTAVRDGMLWQQGKIDLSGATLQAWVTEFNRYNRRQLEIRDKTVEKVVITGVFSAKDPDSFANALRDTYGIPYTSSGAPGSGVGKIYLGVRK